MKPPGRNELRAPFLGVVSFLVVSAGVTTASCGGRPGEEGAGPASGGEDPAIGTESMTYAASVSGNPAKMKMGGTVKLSVKYRNLGPEPWRAASLSASGKPLMACVRWLDMGGMPLDRVADCVPIVLDVQPGRAITVKVRIAPPETPGTYLFRPDLCQEAVGCFSEARIPAELPVAVEVVPVLSADAMRFGYEIDAPSGLRAGKRALVRVRFTNTSTVPWAASRLVGTASPLNASYRWLAPDGGGVGPDGLRTPILEDVPPGAPIDLGLEVVAPKRPGTYLLQPDLVQEGVSWFSAPAPPEGEPVPVQISP